MPGRLTTLGATLNEAARAVRTAGGSPHLIALAKTTYEEPGPTARWVYEVAPTAAAAAQLVVTMTSDRETPNFRRWDGVTDSGEKVIFYSRRDLPPRPLSVLIAGAQPGAQTDDVYQKVEERRRPVEYRMVSDGGGGPFLLLTPETVSQLGDPDHLTVTLDRTGGRDS